MFCYIKKKQKQQQTFWWFQVIFPSSLIPFDPVILEKKIDMGKAIGGNTFCPGKLKRWIQEMAIIQNLSRWAIHLTILLAGNGNKKNQYGVLSLNSSL